MEEIINKYSEFYNKLYSEVGDLNHDKEEIGVEFILHEENSCLQNAIDESNFRKKVTIGIPTYVMEHFDDDQRLSYATSVAAHEFAHDQHPSIGSSSFRNFLSDMEELENFYDEPIKGKIIQDTNIFKSIRSKLIEKDVDKAATRYKLLKEEEYPIFELGKGFSWENLYKEPEKISFIEGGSKMFDDGTYMNMYGYSKGDLHDLAFKDHCLDPMYIPDSTPHYEHYYSLGNTHPNMVQRVQASMSEYENHVSVFFDIFRFTHEEMTFSVEITRDEISRGVDSNSRLDIYKYSNPNKWDERLSLSQGGSISNEEYITHKIKELTAYIKWEQKNFYGNEITNVLFHNYSDDSVNAGSIRVQGVDPEGLHVEFLYDEAGRIERKQNTYNSFLI
jgi:hypothetical protein